MKLRLLSLIILMLVMLVSCDVRINPDVNFVLSQDSIDFDYILVNLDASQEISFTNTGTKECEISKIELEFYDPVTTSSEFSIIDGGLQAPITFAQYDKRTVDIQFQPENAGSKIANLIIEYIVFEETSVITVPLKGIGYHNLIHVEPAMISYIPSYIGENQSDQVVITNFGPKPLTINSIRIGSLNSSTQPNEFVVANGWDGNSIVLNPDESTNLTVQFSPSLLGDKLANLIVNVDDSSLDFCSGLNGECIKNLNFLTDSNLPDGLHGSAYSTMIDYEGGDGTYTLSVTNNDLPKGLQLIDDIISGIPEEHGTFQISLTLKDGLGHSISKMYTLFIAYARLIRDPSDVDQSYLFNQSNNIGTYTVNLIAQGDVSLTVNSISLTGDGETSGEATIESQPTLPITMNPGDSIQIVIKVVSLLDIGRDITLTVHHTGYNSPFSKKFEWEVGARYIFVVDKSGSMVSSWSSSSYIVHDINGNTIPYPSRWQAVQSMVADRINALTDECKFEIIAFNSNTYYCFNQLKDATTQNKNLALTWLYNLSAGGGSMFYNPLYNAFNQFGGVDNIQFFSDGAPGDGNKTLQAASGWINTQISYNSNFRFEVNQIGGSPMSFMITLGAFPNSMFTLY